MSLQAGTHAFGQGVRLMLCRGVCKKCKNEYKSGCEGWNKPSKLDLAAHDIFNGRYNMDDILWDAGYVLCTQYLGDGDKFLVGCNEHIKDALRSAGVVGREFYEYDYSDFLYLMSVRAGPVPKDCPFYLEHLMIGADEKDKSE